MECKSTHSLLVEAHLALGLACGIFAAPRTIGKRVSRVFGCTDALLFWRHRIEHGMNGTSFCSLVSAGKPSDSMQEQELHHSMPGHCMVSLRDATFETLK